MNRRRAGLIVATLVAGLACSGVGAGAQTTGPSPPEPVTVTCDNGATFTRDIQSDGQAATIGDLPAGTRCRAATGDLSAESGPVPGGGTVGVELDRPPAVLTVDPPLGRAGFTTHATGAGFPPDAPVVLQWDRGISGATVTRSDATG